MSDGNIGRAEANHDPELRQISFAAFDKFMQVAAAIGWSQRLLARNAGLNRSSLRRAAGCTGQRDAGCTTNLKLTEFVSLARCLDLDPAEVLREILS